MMGIDNVGGGVVITTPGMTVVDLGQNSNLNIQTGNSDINIKTGPGVTDVVIIDTPPAQSGQGASSSTSVLILAPGTNPASLNGQQIHDAINRLEQAVQSLDNVINGNQGTGPGSTDDPTGTMGTSVASFLTDGAGINLDDMASIIARAMIIQNNSEETNALQTALGAREAARGELLGQADQLNKEANDMRSAATTQMIVGVTCSAISLGISIGTLGAGIKTMGEVASLKVPKVEEEGSEDSVSTKTNTKPTELETEDTSETEPPTTRQRSDAFSGKKQHDELMQERLNQRGTSKDPSVQSKEEETTRQSDQRKLDINKKIEGEIKYEGKKTQFEKDMKLIGAKESVIGSVQSIGQTVAQLGNTLGSYYGTMGQALAKDDEAEGSRDAAEAQYLQGVADTANSMLQKVSDNAKQIISFLQAVQESKSDEMRSITRG